jgi:hypothetical protein
MNEIAPHPNPLPARGERECAATLPPRPVYGERKEPAPKAWEGEGQS